MKGRRGNAVGGRRRSVRQMMSKEQKGPKAEPVRLERREAGPEQAAIEMSSGDRDEVCEDGQKEAGFQRMLLPKEA